MYKGLQVVTFLNKFVLNPNFIMANQAKISSFFSTSNKRPLSESNKVTPSKKKKVQGEECQQSDENKQDVERLTKSDDSFTISNSTTTNQYLNDNIGETWYKALHTEFNKPYFLQLIKFVDGEREKGTVYPPSNEVFNWTKLCPIKQVKVVILGQDPYHGPKQAHGLCFSVQQGVKSPPSLVNMYKELSNDIDDFQIPSHGTLNGWAEQGVLLLNACLTVRAHQANSHAGKGWEKLTDAVISWLNKNLTGVVFMLWGSYAQKKGACINQKKHHVLKAVHPSPLSAHRGFLGCKHFSKCNDFLIQQGQTPIDWTHLPAQ